MLYVRINCIRAVKDDEPADEKYIQVYICKWLHILISTFNRVIAGYSSFVPFRPYIQIWRQGLPLVSLEKKASQKTIFTVYMNRQKKTMEIHCYIYFIHVRTIQVHSCVCLGEISQGVEKFECILSNKVRTNFRIHHTIIYKYINETRTAHHTNTRA